MLPAPNPRPRASQNRHPNARFDLGLDAGSNRQRHACVLTIGCERHADCGREQLRDCTVWGADSVDGDCGVERAAYWEWE